MPGLLTRTARGAAFVFAIGLMAASSVAAQDGIVGDWQGTISAGGQTLEMAFHVTEAEDGTLATTLDVPAQGAFGIPVEEPAFAEGVFTFGMSMAPGGASYSGTLSEDGATLTGTWTQGGMDVELNMTRSEE